MQTIRAIVFDLDETLYDEAHYVESGLAAVAKELASNSGFEVSTLLKVMQEDIRLNGRGTAFNAALKALGQLDTPDAIANTLAVYRNHLPDIQLFPDAKALLQFLAVNMPQLKTGLVTDGLPRMQKNKVQALSLDLAFNTICYCWELDAPKPSPKGFEQVVNTIGCKPNECIMVGDRVDNDMAPAKALGMFTVRVVRGRYADQPSPPDLVDISLPDLYSLPDLLKGMV
jgi:putative hydrolase of the HAD superfamily